MDTEQDIYPHLPSPFRNLPSPCLPSPSPFRDLPPPPHSPTPPEHPISQHRSIVYQRREVPPVDITDLVNSASFKLMSDSMFFIQVISNVSLSEPVAKWDDDAMDRLHNPPIVLLEIPDPGIRQSISMYLTLKHTFQDAYEHIALFFRQNFANTPGAATIQSYKNVEKLIATYTGIEAILHNMCLGLCDAFTRPFADLDTCSLCHAPCWNLQTQRNKKVPRSTDPVTAQYA